MSEERLDKALEAMRNETADDGELARARDRVWGRLSEAALCADFRARFQEYADGTLESGPRLLLEDHLGRCAGCRAALAAQRGERTAAPQPRRAAHWPRWGTWAAAAALFLGIAYLGRAHLDSLLAPGGPRATVASVTGSLYLLPQGVLAPGAEIGEDEVVRTGPGSRAVLRLADGSLVEVNERTELSVHAARSGRVVRLERGDVIVQAARQRRGRLRVETRDATASVKGTVFAVSSGLGGTLVSVVEGSVAVAQGGGETLLGPGQQAASSPALIRSVPEAVAWSPDAGTYLGILASLAQIEKQVALLPSPELRTRSRLLHLLPPATVVYGAMPNIGDTVGRTLEFADQQAAANPAFESWWTSDSGRSLRRLLGHLESAAHLCADEIVFGWSRGGAAGDVSLPMILAEVQPGREADIATVLEALAGPGGGRAPAYRFADTLLVLSDSEAHLERVVAGLGRGGETPFVGAIGERYARGAGWLLALDLESILASTASPGGSPADVAGISRARHLFLERRAPQGVEENDLTLAFAGPRIGMASVLAEAGSGGAAEYLPSGVLAAGYVSMREPEQVFGEMLRLATQSDPLAAGRLAEAEAKLGLSFSGDIAASIGTESAVGIESVSTAGLGWVMATLVHDPARLDGAIRALARACNEASEAAGRPGRIFVEQEASGGRTWMSLQPASGPVPLVWTYDRGYLVAASDRGAALRAIATRGGGSALVWSHQFRTRLPASMGLHPSGFAWLDTKGAFEGYAGLTADPVLRTLLEEREPVLVVFSATGEQIRASSRNRLTGLMMDLMLLQNLPRNP